MLRMILLEAVIGLILHCFGVFCLLLSRHSWDKSAMRLFVVSDVPGPSDTERVDCGREQKPPSQVITFIEPQTVYENMYPTIQAWERAAVNNTSAFFSISATHQKDGRPTEHWGVAKDLTAIPSIVAFCVRRHKE